MKDLETRITQLKDSPTLHKFYAISETPELSELLLCSDEMKRQIDELRPLSGSMWEAIQMKLKISWTYDSNAIEGSTLTREETHFLLTEGLTADGKPFKDFLDANNHADAVDYLQEIVHDQRPITEGLIKELNALLMTGVKYTIARDQFGAIFHKPAHPGQYKKQPNHVIQADGTHHYYVEPLQVPMQMEELILWINGNIDKQHPIITAAVSHYNMVRIHPFDDGNGRGARLLMNLILMKKGYPLAIIRHRNRRQYIQGLRQADQGNLAPFTEFVAQADIETAKEMVGDLRLGVEQEGGRKA